MPFSTPREKITFMISGLVGLKRSVRGNSIDALRRAKAESVLLCLFLFISIGNHHPIELADLHGL
jgi:hypothetical protein